MTSIPKGPKLADAFDEESLDIAHSCLMDDGIHLLNEVSCCNRKWANILVGKQLRFEEAFQELKGMCVHEKLEMEANGLPEEVYSLS